MPGVTLATGDRAVTAQPDGIYVSITTSELFCINLRHFARLGQQSCDTHTHSFNVVSTETLSLFVRDGDVIRVLERFSNVKLDLSAQLL